MMGRGGVRVLCGKRVRVMGGKMGRVMGGKSGTVMVGFWVGKDGGLIWEKKDYG